MRRFCSTPAERLASVALRYRSPWRPRAPVRRFDRGAGLSTDSSRAAGAADSPFTRSERLARLEAVLFVAGEPMSTRKLAQFASLADGTEARTLVRRLNRMYDAGGSSFRVEEVAGGFQLLTRPKFSRWLRQLHQAPVETRLSGPALETLAVVAYRQPAPRAEIEGIRGVQCGEMLRQLLERDLVKIGGRSDELGRPFLYATTKRFLQVFGLRHLDELPRAEFLNGDHRHATVGDGDGDSAATSTLASAECIDPNEEFDVNVRESDLAPTEGEPADPRNPLSPSAACEESASTAVLDDARADLEEDDDDDLDDDLEDDDDDDDEEDDDDFDDDWEEVDDDDDEWEDDEEDDDEWEDDDDDDDDDWEEDDEEDEVA